MQCCDRRRLSTSASRAWRAEGGRTGDRLLVSCARDRRSRKSCSHERGGDPRLVCRGPTTIWGSGMTTLIIIPTYLEAENVGDVVRQVRASAPDADILVVDDSSPDGTADLAKAAGSEVGQVEVLGLPEKGGLGVAYRAGFRHGFSLGYDVIVQMDADFSHEPAALPDLLGKIETGADVAIGSRYVAGGNIPNWPTTRRVLSRVGNFYASTVLGLKVHDATSGFRAYRAGVLETVEAGATRATGSAVCRRCRGTSSARPCRWSRGGAFAIGCCADVRRRSTSRPPRARRRPRPCRWRHRRAQGDWRPSPRSVRAPSLAMPDAAGAVHSSTQQSSPLTAAEQSGNRQPTARRHDRRLLHVAFALALIPVAFRPNGWSGRGASPLPASRRTS